MAMTAKERWDKWYAANRVRYNAYQRAYWKQRRDYQTLPPEELRRRKLARLIAWRDANPLLVQAGQAATNANRRAKRGAIPGILTSGDVLELWERQPSCRDCGSGRGIDHIQPMRSGGANLPTNLQNLCMRCNARKENARRHATTGAKSLVQLG